MGGDPGRRPFPRYWGGGDCETPLFRLKLSGPSTSSKVQAPTGRSLSCSVWPLPLLPPILTPWKAAVPNVSPAVPSCSALSAPFLCDHFLPPQRVDWGPLLGEPLPLCPHSPFYTRSSLPASLPVSHRPVQLTYVQGPRAEKAQNHCVE